LPIAPANPHPDTGEILDTVTTGTPCKPSNKTESYVKLYNSFFVPARVLKHIQGGTVRLSEEALDLVKCRISRSKLLKENYRLAQQEGQRYRDRWSVEECAVELDLDFTTTHNWDAAEEYGNIIWRVLKFIIGVPILILRVIFFVFGCLFCVFALFAFCGLLGADGA
jgi:hypothetical protein